MNFQKGHPARRRAAAAGGRDSPDSGKDPARTAPRCDALVGALHGQGFGGQSDAGPLRLESPWAQPPPEVRSYTLSWDPRLPEKLEDVGRLYLNPPELARPSISKNRVKHYTS